MWILGLNVRATRTPYFSKSFSPPPHSSALQVSVIWATKPLKDISGFEAGLDRNTSLECKPQPHYISIPKTWERFPGSTHHWNGLLASLNLFRN